MARCRDRAEILTNTFDTHSNVFLPSDQHLPKFNRVAEQFEGPGPRDAFHAEMSKLVFYGLSNGCILVRQGIKVALKSNIPVDTSAEFESIEARAKTAGDHTPFDAPVVFQGKARVSSFESLWFSWSHIRRVLAQGYQKARVKRVTEPEPPESHGRYAEINRT